MRTETVRIRLSHDERKVLKTCSDKLKKPISTVAREMILEGLGKQTFKPQTKKLFNKVIRKGKYLDAKREFTDMMGEMFFISNIYTRIWQTCNADYAIHRDISMDKVTYLRDKAMKIYNKCEPEHKKLMIKEVTMLLALDRKTIIDSLEHRRRNKQIIPKDETVYVERDFDEMQKQISIEMSKGKKE